jgi:hypothetical protein
MRLLLELEHEEYSFEKLFVGVITPPKMSEAFKCKTSAINYFLLLLGNGEIILF